MKVITTTSNINQVTPEGILLAPENFPSKQQFQETLLTAMPELISGATRFALKLSEALHLGVTMLNQFERFDRIE